MTDTYVEQLISVRRTTKDYVLMIAICLAAAFISIFLAFFILQFPILIFLIALTLYGANKLLGKFGVEYEYIFTNGDLDFDKISGKQDRKRIITVDCTKIEKAGLFTPDRQLTADFDKKYFLCDLNDDSAKYFITYRHNNLGKVMIVFSPDDSLRAVLDKSIPRTVSDGIFRG